MINNINSNNHSLTHNFTALQSPTLPVVQLPQYPWDGNLANRNATNITTINLEALGDIVEQICFKHLQLANARDLEVVLPGGSDELLQRYSFYAA